jgi:hypothetical protein
MMLQSESEVHLAQALFPVSLMVSYHPNTYIHTSNQYPDGSLLILVYIHTYIHINIASGRAVQRGAFSGSGRHRSFRTIRPAQIHGRPRAVLGLRVSVCMYVCKCMYVCVYWWQY